MSREENCSSRCLTRSDGKFVVPVQVSLNRLCHVEKKGGCTMKEIKKILFPVDLSAVSSMLAPAVISLAGKFDAEVHLLFVAGSFEKFKTFYIPHPSLKSFGEEVLRGGEKKLKEFVEEFFGEFPRWKTVVVQGDPAEEILKYVSSEKLDLVIMGTHGRKGLDRILFGSVANQVVQNSPAPVLTINPYRSV
jgi:nucleotide-binding universal stress UspA family protein